MDVEERTHAARGERADPLQVIATKESIRTWVAASSKEWCLRVLALHKVLGKDSNGCLSWFHGWDEAKYWPMVDSQVYGRHPRMA